MSARYLIRFDDLCPTMNWRVWEEIEPMLLSSGVKPLLAVVPDNRDPHLQVDAPHEGFWDRVRAWGSYGWTIGMHGYRHEYVTRHSGIIGKNRFSEFAGLPRREQESKLASALQILRRESVPAEVWVAPAHSFDQTTVDLLLQFGVRCISDGYFAYPGFDCSGAFWIPQQLWNFEARPFGVWTICLHHNQWRQRDVEQFRQKLSRFRERVASLAEITGRYQRRKLTAWDRAGARLFRLRLQMCPT